MDAWIGHLFEALDELVDVSAEYATATAEMAQRLAARLRPSDGTAG